MSYYIDLEKITINDYKEILRTADFIPSWRILQENIEHNLKIIKKQNIKNLAELQKALATKSKVQKFAHQSRLPEDYLNVLRRAINGYQPKPNKIKDFPSINKETVQKLEDLGFKNSLQLYEQILTPEKRAELAGKSGIPGDEIEKLAKLSDLSRIRWVNHTFAYVLLEAGYDSAQKVAAADYNTMYETIKKLNTERQLYKGNIGAHDMKLCVEIAGGLDFDIVL